MNSAPGGAAEATEATNGTNRVTVSGCGASWTGRARRGHFAATFREALDNFQRTPHAVTGVLLDLVRFGAAAVGIAARDKRTSDDAKPGSEARLSAITRMSRVPYV